MHTHVYIYVYIEILVTAQKVQHLIFASLIGIEVWCDVQDKGSFDLAVEKVQIAEGRIWTHHKISFELF